MPGDKVGQLYIVSTPIGNLDDITYRAVQTLRLVDKIAAEDTRRTRILLNHYEIKTSLTSYNSFNKGRKSRELVQNLKIGNDIALVSDAGTPGISDPLYWLAQTAIDEDIQIIPLPGPVAAITALTVSGLPTDRFLFEGFLPRKKRRSQILETLAKEKRTLVFYESPHRLEKTMRDLYECFGDRKIAIAREMTKMHEEVLRGTLSEFMDTLSGRKWKGEVTLIVAGSPK